MVNCNPETVSTDYDTSDRLYFEPLTLEHVLAVVRDGKTDDRGDRSIRWPDAAEARRRGSSEAGVPILGTASSRSTWRRTGHGSARCSTELGYTAPPYATANGPEQALECAEQVGFPLLVRPSYVLGGRAMEIVYSVDGLRDYLTRGSGTQAGRARSTSTASSRTRSRSTSTRSATATDVWVAGIMQHVEEAGIHSGDSACVLPPHTLGAEIVEQIREQTVGIARALGVVGLLNVQFAIHGQQGLHVIEANPRASRTVPFVSKAIGLPLAKLACRVVLGEKLADLDLPEDTDQRTRVRQGGRAALQPVHGGRRAARARDALDRRGDGDRPGLPDRIRQGPGGGRSASCRTRGTAFITVADSDKAAATGLAALFDELGFRIIATRGHRPGDPPAGDPGRGDQQDRRGLAARRRLDRARRRRHRHQHAGGHRCPVRRLRDPDLGDRPRNPVHHHDRRRDRRRARDLGRRAAARPRCCRSRRSTRGGSRVSARSAVPS